MSDLDISNLLSNAANFLTNNNYEEAKISYKSVLKIDKSNIEALKGYGLCCFNLKDYDNALKAFKKAIKIDANDATSLYYVASLSILNDKPLDAINYSKKVIDLRPDYFDAYKILFTLYLKLQQFDDILALQKTLEANNVEIKDDTIHLVLGTAYMIKKQYKAAIDFFKIAYEFNSTKEQTCNNLGVCYMSLGDYENAVKAFETSLTINPNNNLTYTDLGTVYQLKGDFLKALEVFNKGLELSPDNYLALLNIANLSNTLRRYDLAINAYEKLLKINPNLKEIQSSLIGAYVKNNMPDKAINLIDEALKTSPRNVPLLFRKAKIYTDLGDFNAANKVYEQIISFKKNSPAIYHAYAVLYTKMKDFDKALQYLNKSLTLDDKNASVHKDLGVIYLMRNQVEYAKDEFDKAIKLGQDDNEILKECADFYYSISDFKKADNLYRKSLKLENNPYTTLSMGINLIGMNKLDEAFAVLEPLLGVLPDEPELLYNLARIFYSKNDFDASARLAKKAYFKVPTVEIANLLGLCLKNLEDYKGAANIFEKIIGEYPLNAFVYDDLEYCYKKMRDKKNLINTLKNANKNLVYDEKRVLKLAKLLSENGQNDEAKSILDKAYFEHPSDNLKKFINNFVS